MTRCIDNAKDTIMHLYESWIMQEVPDAYSCSQRTMALLVFRFRAVAINTTLRCCFQHKSQDSHTD